MMSRLCCEFVIALLIFYLTPEHSFRRNSYITRHLNLHRYLPHGYSIFHVNHVNLNKKKFGYIHRISSLYCTDGDIGGDVYDLDASLDSLKSSFNEMIDGIEVAELGLLLMVRLDICLMIIHILTISDSRDSLLYNYSI